MPVRDREAPGLPEMYPRCTRVLHGQATKNGQFAGISSKPSDGLEPSTPPYHGTSQATGRNLRQRFWLVLGPPGLRRFAVDCHRLQPRGSIKAPSFVASTGYSACPGGL